MKKTKTIIVDIDEKIEMYFCGVGRYNEEDRAKAEFERQTSETIEHIKNVITDEVTKDGKEGIITVQLFIHYTAEK